MSDNYSRLKKWAKDAASGKTSKIPYIDITDLINEVENLRATIAATEAAKATGTAGEQKPRAWLIEYEYLAGVTLKGEGLRRTENWAKASFVSDSKDYADHPDFEQEGTRNIVVTPLLPAEAARQPAPVAHIKTWRERMTDGRRVQNSEWCKDEEIADLRAALAAAPVLSDEQIDHIARSYFADEHGQTKAKGVIHDALRQAGVADAGTLKEAERYRYLRSVVYPEKFYASGHPSWVIRYHLRGETFDSAVDHAIVAATNRSQP